MNYYLTTEILRAKPLRWFSHLLRAAEILYISLGNPYNVPSVLL